MSDKVYRIVAAKPTDFLVLSVWAVAKFSVNITRN